MPLADPSGATATIGVAGNGPRDGRNNEGRRRRNTGQNVNPALATFLPPVSPGSAIGFSNQLQGLTMNRAAALASLVAASKAARANFITAKADIRQKRIADTVTAEGSALTAGTLGSSADLKQRARAVAEAANARSTARNQLLQQLSGYKLQALQAQAGYKLGVGQVQSQKAAEQAAQATNEFQNDVAAGVTADTTAQGKGVNTSVRVPPNSTHMQARIINLASSQIGVPYVWGESDPKGGGTAAFDCSGLTMWVASKFGISLPHRAADQANMLPHIDRAHLRPGDLVFFGSPVHHVGIYVGNGNMIDAPNSGANVRVEPLFGDFVYGGRLQR